MNKKIIYVIELLFMSFLLFTIRISTVQNRNNLRNNILSYIAKSKSSTPLHLAVQLGDVNLAKEYLVQGVDWATFENINLKDLFPQVNAKDGMNFTPLELAARYKSDKWIDRIFKPDIKIAKLLIENGADVNINNGGPLESSIQFRKPDFIKLLIKNGADVNLKNEHGITPLQNAKIFGYKNIIKILVDAHAKE